MQKFQFSKRIARFIIKYIILFTLALLTTISSTFAKQPENSPSKIHIETVNSTATTPQQLLEQGETLYQAGRLTEAVSVLQQAVGGYQREGNNLGQAAALTNLSLVYQQMSLLKQAAEAINISLQLIGWDQNNQKLNVNDPKSELLEILAPTLDIQAGLLLALGESDVSFQTSQQSEQIWKRLGNKSGVTRSQINQAQALRVSGFYRRSLDILNKVSQELQIQPASVVKLTALRDLGNAQLQVGYLNKSEESLQQSLKIAQRLQLPQEISLTELSLGNITRAEDNIKYADAITHYENAAKTAPNLLIKVEAQINQLSLLVDKEQIAEAKTLIPIIESQLVSLPTNQAGIYARIKFARTITKIGNQKEIGEILTTCVQQAETINDKRAQSYALGSLGELYEQNNQWQEARDVTQQAWFITQEIDASDIAYRWEWQLGRLLKAQGNIAEAIKAYDAAVNTLQSLRTDLVGLNQQVQFNFRDSIEPIYRQSVELLLQQKGQDLDKVLQRMQALQLAELDNFFHQACLSNQFVTLNKVEEKHPQTAIFYPIILDHQLEIILKLPNKRFVHKTFLVKRQDVEEVIKQMRDTIVEPDRNKEFQAASKKLYSWLITPVETDLKNSQVNTLVFVPDGSLRNIPMSGLFDGKDYLIKKYAIAINPGLQLFPPKSLEHEKLNALVGGLNESSKTGNFAKLPYVRDEIKSIQQSGISTTILLNENFTSTNLEKNINNQPFKIVHLATHGQFSSKAEDTFILAHNDEKIKVIDLDSLLKSREQNLKQPVELLVLSACQTAAGDNRAALGLAGVAIRAGARSTLASLWEIGDDSTAIFIKEFYSQLTHGKTTVQALQAAQKRLLSDDEYNHPLNWAPYVLVGNWL